MMTDIDYAALEALESAATPAPWVCVVPKGMTVARRVDGPGNETAAWSGHGNDARAKANAAFIAALRNAAPDLIAKAQERDELNILLGECQEANSGLVSMMSRRDEELASLRTERDVAIREVAAQGRLTGQAQAEADALRALLDEAREVVKPFADIRNVSGRVEHHIRARSFLAKLGE